MSAALALIDDVYLDRELVARGKLYDFVRLAWPLVEPVEYVHNWHVEEVCEHLEAVSRGEILRLIINEPPGTMKSLSVCVFWPIWEWIRKPETKWIFASFDSSLARRDSERALEVMQSDWFQARWPHVKFVHDRVAAADYKNTAGGWRFATSIKGRVTGRHADIQVVDDPIKPKDVGGLHSMSVTKKALAEVLDWWKRTMPSRMANPATGRRVIIMQRLHENDLAGEMLREGGYVHLRLPMRFEKAEPCRTRWGGDRRTTEGELLWPERYPEHVVTNLEKTEMGPNIAAAQLQQRPVPAGGGIFRREWIRFWHHGAGVKYGPVGARLLGAAGDPDMVCEQLPTQGIQVQSWDMAFKKTDDSDFVAGGVWQKDGARFYLLDQVRDRLSFTESAAALVKLSAKWPKALEKLVEDKANGTGIEDTLKKTVPGIVLVNPSGGKEARANAVQPLFAAGNVFLPHPHLAPWVEEYVDELVTFPRGVNDDQVDQTTQALLRLHVRTSSLAEAMKKLQEEM